MGKRKFTQCTQCGLCCKVVGHSPVGKFLPIRPDGSCGHLTEAGQCAIYEDRPKFCRVEEFKPKRMSWRKYLNLNAALCNRMQEKFGYPLRLRVRMKR